MKKLTLLLAIFLAAGGSFAGSIAFNETFEGLTLGTIDGQNGWAVSGSGSATVQNTDAQAGSQALSMTSSTVSRTFGGGATNTTITFWTKPTLSEAPPASIAADASAVFYVDTNNVLVAYDGTSNSVVSGAVFSNDWNKIEVSCDYLSKVWNLKLNDVLVVTDFSFYGSATSFSEIELIEPSTNTLAFDTLQLIGSAPEAPVGNVVLAQWDYNDATENNSASAVGITASALGGWGPETQNDKAENNYGEDCWFLQKKTTLITNVFTLTVDPAYLMNITDVTIDHASSKFICSWEHSTDGAIWTPVAPATTHGFIFGVWTRGEGATNLSLNSLVGTNYFKWVMDGANYEAGRLDNLTVKGSLTAATGSSDLLYVATPHAFKPGEPQAIDLVIQNNGFDAANVVASLTSLNGLFSVNSGSVTTALITAGGGTATNTFTISAISNATAQLYNNAFKIDLTGIGTDGSTNTASANIDVEVLSTAFASMNQTDFAAALSGTDTATLTVSNTAAFPLQFTVSSTEAWLLHPAGTLTLAAGTSTGITVTADASLTAGQGQYTDTLVVDWSNNGSQPDPTNFPVVFDVGPKVSFTGQAIDQAGGVNNIPSKYEPGEILFITVSNINDGAITVNNVTNTLSASTAFSISPLTTTVYPSLTVGQTAFTVYQVDISPSAAHGTYTFTVQNANADGSWSGSFTLDVFKQAIPSASPASLTINVPAGGTATGTITLTNAGNASTTFKISDNGTLPVTSYLVTTQAATMVSFLPVFDIPDTNTTFIDWSGSSTSTPPAEIGFDFPFYGVTYTDFWVGRFGSFGFNGNEYLAPYWGNIASETNTIRYKKEAGRLVVAWNNRATENEFQAWLYDDGRIQYLYEGILADHEDRMIGLIHGGDSEYINHTPAGGRKSLLLTPVSWITYSPVSGSVQGLGGQAITVAVDASDQASGTSSSFTAIVTWGDGSTSEVLVNVVVGGGTPSMSVTPNPVNFSGPAGAITKTNMVLENTGDVPLIYTITDIDAQAAGYGWERTTFDWDNSHWDANSGSAVLLGGDDEGYSELIPIGFGFPFYGSVYTQLSIGVNGGLSLSETNLMTSVYLEDVNSGTARNWVSRTNTLSSATPITTIDGSSPDVIDIPDHMIAPYWRDLVLDNNSEIRYSGDANQLVVSWENIQQTDTGEDQTFQVILNRDGTILFQYYHVSDTSAWPNAQIGLRDTTGRVVNASLIYSGTEENPGTVTYTPDYTTVTNWRRWDGSITNWPAPDYDVEITVTNGTNVVTTYSDTVTEEAILFTPSNSVIISVNPASGTLPIGETQVVEVCGDARILTPGGSGSVTTGTTFEVVHDGGVESVDVTFEALGTDDPGYQALKDADSDGDGRTDIEENTFGSDGIVDVVQNPDGSRTLTWPTPTDSINRNFIVWYTTSLTSGWTKLKEIGNATTYIDTEHANEPVIYYKVTVQ